MGTALVTGATSGIGLELVWQLAAARHDLVLVARDHQRLAALAEDLRQVAGVGAQVLPADLSTAQGRQKVAQRLLRTGAAGTGSPNPAEAGSTTRPGPAGTGSGTGPQGYARLDPACLRDHVRSQGPGRQGGSRLPARSARGPRTAQEVARRPVDLLVNNAGFGLGQAFVGGDVDRERRALEVMVGAVMELSHAALPGMVERGHGAVLNIASLASLTAMGTYAAHKAWVRTFTEGLATELKGTGVSATVVCPGLTRTEFHERAHMEDVWPSLVWTDAQEVARQALDAVRRGQVICTPTLRYQAAAALLRLSPRWLVRRVAGHASSATRY